MSNLKKSSRKYQHENSHKLRTFKSNSVYPRSYDASTNLQLKNDSNYFQQFKKTKLSNKSTNLLNQTNSNESATNLDNSKNSKNLNSHYLKEKLARYSTGKHFHKIKFINLKGMFKRHWCFFLIVVIALSTLTVHSSTQAYIDKLQTDSNELIATLEDTNKKVEKLKKENVKLLKEKDSFTQDAEELDTKMVQNEQLLNDYIHQVNELNKKIEERTSWTIPTVSLYVPINDSYFKTYMDYRKITSKSSSQYKLLHSDKVKYDDDGLIRSVDGNYIGVALGSKYGVVGDKFILTLQRSDGLLHEVKLLKVEEKADKDTTDGYYASHRDLVEFVIDVDKAKGSYPTAIRMGDFNYSDSFNGKITGIKKVIQ